MHDWPEGWLSLLAVAEAEPRDKKRFDERRICPLDDALGELAKWRRYTGQNAGRGSDAILDATRKVAELMNMTPERNDMRGVGRNDPCPCGSGRKAKKCCLGLV